jgi:hypothetical protein
MVFSSADGVDVAIGADSSNRQPLSVVSGCRNQDLLKACHSPAGTQPDLA